MMDFLFASFCEIFDRICSFLERRILSTWTQNGMVPKTNTTLSCRLSLKTKEHAGSQQQQQQSSKEKGRNR